MNPHPAKVTILMVCSLNAYPAESDGAMARLQANSHGPQGIEFSDPAKSKFLPSLECLGSQTYEEAELLGWVYKKTPLIVLSRRPLKSPAPQLPVFTASPKGSIATLMTHYQNDCLPGGPSLVLELVVASMPLNLTEAVPFFRGLISAETLNLQAVSA